jgi:hypothetical protein
MTWCDKNGVAQTSKIVVTISNWHFNRNTLKEPIAPTCKLENVMITLKLSSTVFESPANLASGSYSASTEEKNSSSDQPSQPTPDIEDSNSAAGGRVVISKTGDTFFFDKNGCIIPYAAFLSLLDNHDFHNYLEKVKEKFNSRVKDPNIPPAPPSSEIGELEEEGEVEDPDAETTNLNKNLAKKRKLNMIYGRKKRLPALQFLNDDENDGEGEIADQIISTEAASGAEDSAVKKRGQRK